MGRRRWQKIGNSSNRKLVTVLETSWSPIRSERVSIEEEKILAKAEEIRLRQSGFVYKSKQTKEVINAELLKGQVFFVDCQLDNSEQKNKLLSKQQINAGIVSQLQKLGASVSQSLTKKVNFVVFMNGRYSTFKFANQNSVPLVSSGWIEESKKLNSLAPTQKHAAVVPDNFRDPVAPRKYKRNYSLEHLEKLKQEGEKKKLKESHKSKDESKSNKLKLNVSLKQADKKVSKDVALLVKQTDKKISKEQKKTETNSIKRQLIRSEKPSKSSSSKMSPPKPSVSKNNSHQENKSPKMPEELSKAVKRKSPSLELIERHSSVPKMTPSPPKLPFTPPKPSTSSSTTPVKRIRIESSWSPLATPPRDLKPKTEQIAVSNITPEQYKMLTETVAALGRFQVVKNAKEGATHVVWGSGRTINLLRGIALGCRILSFNWVEESRKKGKWLPENDFIAPAYADADKEIQSRRKRFGDFFSCHLLRSVGPMYVNSGVKSALPDDLRSLIKICGGTLVKNIQDAVLVIGPPPDKLVFSTTSFVKENWIYSCISSYHVKPIKPFVYESANSNSPE